MVGGSMGRVKKRALEEFLVSGSCVDIGCGRGLYGLVCETKCDSVLQVDLCDRRADVAKQFPFEVVDANDLNFGERKFDNVVAFDVMEHLEDDVGFLQGLRKVCRGRLILSVPNAEDSQVRQLRLTHEHHCDKTHLHIYTSDGLVELLEKCGWNIVAIKPVYNTCLFDFPVALSSGAWLARVAAKFIMLQMRIFSKLGLFENRCIADWVCVAEPRLDG